MDIKALLVALLSATYKMDEAAVASLIKEDGTVTDTALQELLDKDKTRVAELSKDKGFNDGYKKAQSEVLSKFEKELKDKYGVGSDKKGLELIADIITEKTPAPTDLTDEQVKKHKVYLDLNESIAKQVADAVADKQKELDTFKSGIERKEIITGARQEALTIFDSLKPVLSSDPAKAAKQKELFLKQIEANNFRKDENGKYILLNEDGTDKTNAHGHRVNFNDYVKQTAGEYYDFQQADPKGSAGNGGNNGGGGNEGKKYVVRDEADFNKQMEAAKTSEERAGIYNAYQEAQKAAN